MDTLILGLSIFFTIHFLPSIPPLHASLQYKLGENVFKGIFALIALAGLILIIYGMREIEFTPLYEPPAWGKHITSLLMLIALYCLISSEVKSSLRMITAHPMLWGITAWSAGHLIANGDLASVILFGSFLVYSLFDIFSANLRGARPNGRTLAIKTDLIVLVSAALVVVGLIYFHESIAGVPLIA